MTQHALALLENPTAHDTFKSAARAHAQEFHVMKILPHYEAIYHRLTP